MLHLLPCLVAAFKQLGWHCELVIKTPEEFKSEYIKICKSSWAERQKYARKQAEGGGKPVDGFIAKAFNETEMIQLDPESKIVWGWTLAPPGISETYDQHLFKVTASDFAHCHRVAGCQHPGVLGTRIAADQNNCIVDICHARCLSNESKDTWVLLNNGTKMAIPGYESFVDKFDVPTVDISDASKGGDAAHGYQLGGVTHFLDFKHRSEALGRGPHGAKCAKLYAKAYHATTASDLDHAIDAINDDAQAKQRIFGQGWSAENQFPLRAELGRLKTSSCVESANHRDMPFRSCHFAFSLLQAARSIQEHHERRSKEAHGWEQPFPPKVARLIREEEMAAAHIQERHVTFTYANGKVVGATVKDATFGDAHVVFDRLKHRNPGMACDCSFGTEKGIPCRHAYVATKKNGQYLYNLTDRKYTTRAWKDVYCTEEADGTLVVESLRIPNMHDVKRHIDLKDTKLCMPPAYRPRAGRPSVKRKERTKKAQGNGKEKKGHYCHCCFRFVTDHTKRNCPERDALELVDNLEPMLAEKSDKAPAENGDAPLPEDMAWQANASVPDEFRDYAPS